MSIYGLSRLFSARSVALIGGSPRPESVGRTVLKNLRQAAFAGDIFLVNTRHDEIDGVKAHRSFAEISAGIDLAVITTPPDQVPAVIDEAGRAGVGAAVIITAGLGHGPGSIAEAAQETARRHGIRLVGPNCLGVILPPLALNASFAGQMVKRGDLALLSQSGGVAAAMVDCGVQRDIGFSAIVSMGDQLDVDFGDLLDYFTLDPQTRSILLYVESIKDARKFMSAARAAARAKPVVVVKSGRTAQSAKAAATHTGALAGSDAVYEAAFRRAGLLRVPDLSELLDAAATLGRVRAVPGNRLSILTNGGGLGVLAVDLLSESGGVLAELDKATYNELDQVLPTTWSKANPVDIIGDADAVRYGHAVDALLRDPNSDAVLVLNVRTALADPLDIARSVVDRVQTYRSSTVARKPVFAAWVGNDEAAEPIFNGADIPSYESESDAVRSFNYLARYREALDNLAKTPPPTPPTLRTDRARAATIIAAAISDRRSWLDPMEAKRILDAYSIPAVPTFQASTPAEAEALSAGLIADGKPVAVKIFSRDIVHKSDIDGVRLDLTDGRAVRDASRTVMDNAARAKPDAKILGVTIQPMINRPKASELIIGLACDPTFGMVVLFGHGGIGVQVIDDKVIALPPLDLNLANDMIARTRVSRLLAGYRNIPPARINDVAQALVQISQLSADFPEISELDINPLLADENGVLALDARIKVGPPVPVFKGQKQAHFAIRPYPLEWERELQLADHREVFVRPVRADDEPLFLKFLSAISLDDLRLRFFAPLKTFGHAFVSRLTQLDYARSIAFAAIDKTTQELIGVVRLHADPDYEIGEYAVLVRSDLKGIGLGWTLMELIIDYARTEGLKTIKGQVLRENAIMIRMCKDLGFCISGDPDDATLYLVELDLKHSLPV